MAESALILATLARRYRLLLASTARIEPQALFTLRLRCGMHMVPEPRRQDDDCGVSR
jgi:cytochrome P450